MPRQRMTPFALAFLLAVPAGSLAVSSLQAAPAPVVRVAQAASFAGTYTLNARASDNVQSAINEAASHVMFLIRGIARSRMRATNPVYQRVTIGETASEFSIAFDQRAPVRTPSNGARTPWTREDGEKFQVMTAVEGGRLHQTFIADDGRRVNVFSLSPDGKTLTMETTVSSPKLPQPLHYRLVFDRV